MLSLFKREERLERLQHAATHSDKEERLCIDYVFSLSSKLYAPYVFGKRKERLCILSLFQRDCNTPQHTAITKRDCVLSIY